MPFVLMSGLLLLLFCWPDLDSWAPTCIIASFIVGILPLFVYNITALPQQSSLFYFLLVYRADTTGRFLQHVPLVQKMVGALLVGLPDATGANPICTTRNLPLFGLLSPASLQCTLRQGSWALGCIALWLIAVFLAIRALWQQRQQARASLANFEERQITMRRALEVGGDRGRQRCRRASGQRGTYSPTFCLQPGGGIGSLDQLTLLSLPAYCYASCYRTPLEE